IAPLPVNLVSFKGVAIDNHTNKIYWTIATDNNTDGFTLEKSYDKETFFPISNIPFSSTSTYSFIDNAIEKNTTYYRLKQLDKSGNYQYSFAISVNNKVSGSVEIFPNPAKSSIQIKSPALINNVVIFDSFGKKVKEISIKENSTIAFIDISNLSCGQYFAEVTNRDNKFVQAFLKH
ncbi:MAG: T9SS type A sorting domain-containing protein, partial [Bacteroidota bacterium]